MGKVRGGEREEQPGRTGERRHSEVLGDPRRRACKARACVLITSPACCHPNAIQQDYYEILGVSKNVDESELKKGEHAAD